MSTHSKNTRVWVAFALLTIINCLIIELDHDGNHAIFGVNDVNFFRSVFVYVAVNITLGLLFLFFGVFCSLIIAIFLNQEVNLKERLKHLIPISSTIIALFFVAVQLFLIETGGEHRDSVSPGMADIYRSGDWVSRIRYDGSKRPVEQINYSKVYFKNEDCEIPGDTTIKWFYSYDGDLLSSEKEIVFCDNVAHEESITIYSYDENNRIKTVLKLDDGGDTLSVTFYERPHVGTKVANTFMNLSDGSRKECISTDVILDDDDINEYVTTTSSCNLGKRIDYRRIKNADGLLLKETEYIIHNDNDTFRIDESIYHYNDDKMISEIRKMKKHENGLVEVPWIEFRYQDSK